MATNLLDLAVAELKAQPDPMPGLDTLAPISQAVLLTTAAEHIARRENEGVRCLAAREMLAAALRLDPDVRLGLDA